jgi:hypothetical protein
VFSGCDLSGITHRENRETGPVDVSVIPEMLAGATYRGRTGGDEYDDLTWIFDKTHFRIVAGQAGLPADLTQALLPADATGYRIDGRWRVDGEELTVTELAVDGKPVDQPPRTLRAMCTPVIRIQADRRQYMFASGTAESLGIQGDIPTWPPGTTRVTGSATFDRSGQGWLKVGYLGMVREKETISDAASLHWEPDLSGYGYAKSTPNEPRFCRLHFNSSQPASMQCMALPPGVYLFYAEWKSDLQDERESVVNSGWCFQYQFKAKWIAVKDKPISQVDFNLVNSDHGEIVVRAPESDSQQRVFLLPWGEPATEPPPVNSEQAWDIAWRGGHRVSVEVQLATFHRIPKGRYRLFLAEYDPPARKPDTQRDYRVQSDEVVTVRADLAAEVSF